MCTIDRAIFHKNAPKNDQNINETLQFQLRNKSQLIARKQSYTHAIRKNNSFKPGTRQS